jgi:alkaline phosphatase D
MRSWLLVFFLFVAIQTFAQPISNIGLPALVGLSHNDAHLVVPHASEIYISLEYQAVGQKEWLQAGLSNFGGELYGSVSTFHLKPLEPATTYRFRIKGDEENILRQVDTDTLRTQSIWEYRTDPPPVTFLVGSCTYINDTPYDRPGKQYGSDTKILRTLAQTPADIMVWGGDNFYFREADCTSPTGMERRIAHAFMHPDMQLARHAHLNLAIWDDHDFGPNDSDRSFKFKNTALDLHRMWWGNPGMTFDIGSSKAQLGLVFRMWLGKPGTTNDLPSYYDQFTFSDCAFFLLDDRTFRAPNKIIDSINGQPNPNKSYWGRAQLDWLKDALISSPASFKFVVNGNQVLNPINDYEGLNHYVAEQQELLDFIADNKISGVFFISGDRHHTEVMQTKHKGTTMTDFTISPLTSGTWTLKPGQPEYDNASRLAGTLVEQQNFAKFSITGARKSRLLTVTCHDADGKELWRKEFALQK